MDFQTLCAAYLGYLACKASHANHVRLHRQYFASWKSHPTKARIKAWHEEIGTKTPSQGNKGLAFLKAMYNWAANQARPEWQWTRDNPAAGIPLTQTPSRDRVMVGHELRTLLQALDFASPKFAAFITVLLTTGCRMGEARKMAWEHVDLVNGYWFKPTTKNGKSQRIPLPKQACAAIQRLPSKARHPFVFTGTYRRAWSAAAVEKLWGQFRSAVRLDDVTLHDFRRTVASRLYTQEKDLLLVKACLNHYDGSATAVYVRLQYDRLAEALQKQANDLFSLAVRPPAEAPHSSPPPVFSERPREIGLGSDAAA